MGEAGRALLKVCEKTIAEKYVIPNVDFSFFENIPGKGARVTEAYAQCAARYEHIDIMYDFFDWHNGVGFYALLKAGAFLNEPRYAAFVDEYARYHLEKGLPPPNINTTAPMLCLLALNAADPAFARLFRERAAFLMAETPRTAKGAFEHTVMGLSYRNEGQIWADTLFMGCVFLAQFGTLAGERMYWNEACRQLLLHYQYLTDPLTGLMFHAYSAEDRSHLSAVRWGRANGWALVASVEILDQIPEDFPKRAEIVRNLFGHIGHIAGYQQPDGGFTTILDDPESGSESTVTCAVYYAVSRALDKGYVTGDYGSLLANARRYILAHVGGDGRMRGTSGGTPVMASAEEYKKIPHTLSYYGQGLAMLALLEMAREEEDAGRQ